MTQSGNLKDLFRLAAARVSEQKDSLFWIKNYSRNVGFEGWLKVETITAWEGRVKKLNNKGPDLELNDGLFVELKAATDFNWNYIKNGATQYGCPCLFLMDGANLGKITTMLSDPEIQVVDFEKFSVIDKEWIIAMITPSGWNS